MKILAAILCVALPSFARVHAKENIANDSFRRVLINTSPQREEELKFLRRRVTENSTEPQFESDNEPQSRIIGGTAEPVGRYPYLAALFQKNVTLDTLRIVCGGTLIAPKVILTAAHCSEYIDVAILGIYDYTNVQGTTYEYFAITSDQKVIYPSYNSETNSADFLLLNLDKPSNFIPIKLNANPSIPSDGQELTVMGWGVDESGYMSKIPKATTVQAVSNSLCSSRYQFKSEISENELCASGDKSDSCQGDSGGPLIIKGVSANNDLLVGIVSFGEDCADWYYPGVYSRVSSVATWLQIKVPEAIFNSHSKTPTPIGVNSNGGTVPTSDGSTSSINGTNCWNLIFFNWC